MDTRIATVARSAILHFLQKTPLFEGIHSDDAKPLSTFLSEVIPSEERAPIQFEIALLSSMCNHIVALVQSPEGDIYAFEDPDCLKSIVIWREDNLEMCVTANHLPDDKSDEESNTKDNTPGDLEPSRLQTKQQGHSSNSGTDSSASCSQRNYCYCSIQRIERELNLVKVSVLEKSDRTYASCS